MLNGLLTTRRSALNAAVSALSFAVLLCGSLTASAQITLDAKSVQTEAAGNSTFTFNHVLGTGVNRLVVCTVALSNPTTGFTQVVPTVSFGSVAMTAIAQAPGSGQSSPKVESEMFWANDSSLSGISGSTVVTVGGLSSVSVGVVAGCSSYFGVLQAAPESSGISYLGSGTAAAVSLSVANAGDLVVDSFSAGFTASTNPTKSANPTTPQIALYDTQLSTSGVLGGSSYYITTASGSFSASWTPGSTGPSRSTYSAIAFAAATVQSYTVTASVSPTSSGTVTLNPQMTNYPSGTSVIITATPAANYSFTGFTGNVLASTSPQTINVTSNTNFTANFTINQCTLTINTVGSGTVTGAGTYNCGSSVPITATAANSWSFAGFSGGLTASTSPQNVTLNTNVTVTATFVQGTVCTLTTSTTGPGSITVSPSTSVACGTQVTITAVPTASQDSLTAWGGALSGTTNPQTLTLNTSTSVSAAFAQTSWPINVTVVGAGTVSANPNASFYAPNTQVTLTATPNAGSFFSAFSGGATGGSPAIVTTSNSATNVTATFITPVITQDAVSHAASASASASTLTWTHVLGAGSSRAMIIEVGETDSVASPDPSAVVTSVTVNGIYATPVPGSVVFGGSSGMVQSQLFYLLDSELPAAGTVTIQVNLTGLVTGISGGAVSLFGVNQGPPEVVATNTNLSGANLINSTFTTLTNNAWIIDTAEDGDVAPLAVDSGQTLSWQAEAKAGTGGGSTEAVPTAGLVSLGWTGNANRFVESMMDFAPATATVPLTYTLNATAGTGGTVTSNPNLVNYPSGAGVLLTANAGVGFVFSNWTGDFTSTTNPLPITMSGNHAVMANFTSAQTCTLMINIIGSGTLNVTSGTVYNCGTVLQLTATPGSGYSFTSYTGSGDAAGYTSTDNPAFFTISAGSTTISTITAEFDPIPQCTLTINTAGGAGSGTVTGAGSYACGTVVPITATPASGWIFNGWSGDFTSTNSSDSVTLDQSDTITATFVQGTACTLTTTVVGGGTVTPSSGTYLCGTQISISAVPNAGQLFNGWTGGLTGSTTPTTLTMATNESVTATFAVNLAGVTGDTRTVTEPSYPPVCTILTAAMAVSSPVETSPDTTRVQTAINNCPSGEAVEFSASSDGTKNAFIIAPITLNAGVTMLVDPEVTILGSIKYADYGCNTSESWCNPLIQIAPNTFPSPGSAIMGDGIIDGRGGATLTDKGESWWATGSDTRPRLIYLSSHTTGAGSDNFTAYKITLQNSPKFHISGFGNDWTVWGVKIKAPPDSPNTDGVDPSGSSNVTVTHSYISDGDDWVSPKADSGHIANITVDNNYFYSGHGVSVGSETNAGLNNMYVHDDIIDNGFGGTSVDSLRIKSGASEGGEVYDVLYKNICINHGGDTIVIDPYYTSDPGTLYPNFHDITFSNVTELIRDSAHKPTMTGYNTAGIVFPLTVTLDNVTFDGAVANDFKAPDNFNNVQFTFGPGPVNVATFLTADAAIPANLITVDNAVSNSNPPYSCPTSMFVYLAGDLTAKTAAVTAGGPATLTAVLQNTVSPLIAGTVSVAEGQDAPTGTINILEGTNVVGTGTISGRLTYITVPNVTVGPHTYTAAYVGDSNYPALSFGSFTVTATAPSNPSPVANAQSVNVPFNTATPVTLVATGSGTLTYSVVTQPTSGTLSGTAPNLTYTPNSNYSGADSFTFKANNGTDSNVATVSITVATPPTAVANAQSVTVPFNTATAITLTASGIGTITYSVTVNPTHGVLSGVIPNLIYTPSSNYSGADSFTFTANNGTTSAPATVSISVSAQVAPTATAQSVNVTFNTAKGITLAATGSGTLTYAVATQPTHGTLTGTAPNLTYTPTTNYSGADSFTFTASNGTVSAPATVTITVSAPAAPTANAQSVPVAFNTATSITLTATGLGSISYTVATNPAHGTLTGTAPNLTYTPTTNYSSADSFTFTANNGTASAPATVSITVAAPPAPTANAQSVPVAFNTATPITLTATGLGTISYTVATQPTHGTLTGTAPSLTYTPVTNYSGADSFTFTATNGTASAPATVSITVAAAPPPVAPVAASQSVNVAFDTATSITLSAAGSGTLTYTVASSPTHGTLSGAAPNVTYTPTSGYAGTDSFTFTASNGSVSNTATVSISVTGGLVWTDTGGSLSATVTAGQTATYTLQIAGWTGATGSVSFTCTGVPVDASCTVSPNPATLNGTATIPVTVTVVTHSATAALDETLSSRSHHGIPLAVMAGLIGCFAGLRRLKNKRSWSILAMCVALGMVFAISGCGGGTAAPADAATGHYTLTLTGAATYNSTTVTQNTPLTLIIQ